MHICACYSDLCIKSVRRKYLYSLKSWKYFDKNKNAAKTRIILHQTLDCWVVTACGGGSNCNKWSLAGQNWHLPTFYEYKFTFWTPDSRNEMRWRQSKAAVFIRGQASDPVSPLSPGPRLTPPLDTAQWTHVPLLSPRCPTLSPPRASPPALRPYSN